MVVNGCLLVVHGCSWLFMVVNGCLLAVYWLFIGCLLVVMPLVRIVIPGYPQALAASIWDVRQLMAAQEKDGQSRLKKLQKVREAKGCHDVS